MDFESFRVNGFPLQTYFKDQGWLNYFEMMNGSTFPYLVKDFWVMAEVYNESSYALEECQKIAENEKLRGKTKAEMGLEDCYGS